MQSVSKYLSTTGDKGKTQFVENLFPAYKIPPMCFLPQTMNLPLSTKFLLG